MGLRYAEIVRMQVNGLGMRGFGRRRPAGAGESPLIALAPAIGNALFRVTGVRIRSLPLLPDGVVPIHA